jgi:ribosomal protein S27AE
LRVIILELLLTLGGDRVRVRARLCERCGGASVLSR